MKNLSMAQKIAVLSEVQAIESLSGNSNSEYNPYPGKITKAKMSKGANKAAYQKMQDWHDGKRNQNLKNCSDAKKILLRE